MIVARRRGRWSVERTNATIFCFTLAYVVIVHIFVNKVYIAVLQLLVKLRPISRTSFGTNMTSGAVDRIGLLDRIGFP